MNYLAHAFLSSESADELIGGLLGDFVKGRLDGRYTPAVRAGIMLHRAIDRYTDAHGAVRASRMLVSEARRRFAGILVDVFYDHFLARHWSRYCAMPLDRFTRSVYAVLGRDPQAYPERLQVILPRMMHDDWLGSYGELAAVDAALNGIARRVRRFGRARVVGDAVVELEQNYAELERHFLEFFPELMAYARRQRRVALAREPWGLTGT